jgi:hypothetical protein
MALAFASFAKGDAIEHAMMRGASHCDFCYKRQKDR